MWEAAQREYAEYLNLREILLGIGLSDQEADEYLDLYDTLQKEVDLLHPAEPDFRVTDHTASLQLTSAALARMQELLNK